MKLWVIIPAGGASRRYVEERAAQGVEFVRSKLDEDLGGRPVLQRTVELFTTISEVAGIIVAGPAADEAFAAFKARHGDKLAVYGVIVCRGGATHRYETVRNALGHVPAEATHIAVHDAARPCTSVELIQRVLDAARRYDAVIPGVPVSDTLKRVGGALEDAEADPLAAILGAPAAKGSGARPIEATVEREHLVGVQTPQVFARGLLMRAYAQRELSSTDDAQLVERLGERAVVVPGDARNLKITRTEDLTLARAILGFKAPTEKPAHLRF
ncbi:2-C-methyl-D-erythritol 4-phosphate cytidylyltransferase [soil metagenome]